MTRSNKAEAVLHSWIHPRVVGTYTAWVCKDCEGPDEPISFTAFPATREGLGAAIEELKTAWKEYPHYEWGVWYDEPNGTHYELFYHSLELVEKARKCAYDTDNEDCSTCGGPTYYCDDCRDWHCSSKQCDWGFE